MYVCTMYVMYVLCINMLHTILVPHCIPRSDMQLCFCALWKNKFEFNHNFVALHVSLLILLRKL